MGLFCNSVPPVVVRLPQFVYQYQCISKYASYHYVLCTDTSDLALASSNCEI